MDLVLNLIFSRILLEYPEMRIPKLRPYVAPHRLVVDAKLFTSILSPNIHLSNFTIYGFENIVVKAIRYEYVMYTCTEVQKFEYNVLFPFSFPFKIFVARKSIVLIIAPWVN